MVDVLDMTCFTLRAPVLLLALVAATSSISMGCDLAPVDPEPTGGSEESGEPATTGASDEAEGGTAGPTSGATEGDGTETAGETEGDPEIDEGMFACGLSSSCNEISWHLEPDDNPDAVRCAAELIVSGQPGVLLATDVPDSSWQEEMILFLHGDGTARVQTRERSCDPLDIDCDVFDDPWQSISDVVECELLATEGLTEACTTGDGDCEWWPWEHLDCGSAVEWTCEDLQAILDAR